MFLPREAKGYTIRETWDTLGMRATRSDALILEDCRLPDDAMVYRSDDIRQFRLAYFNWFWGSYTSVYLGVAQAAYDELRRTMQPRPIAVISGPFRPSLRLLCVIYSSDPTAASIAERRRFVTSAPPAL